MSFSNENMHTSFDSDAYSLHLAHVWNSNRASSFTMPWERVMPTPWQACKRMRTVYSDMVRVAMPPIPVRQSPDAQLDIYIYR